MPRIKRISYHGRRRAAERQISEQELLEVLNDYSLSRPAANGDRMLFEGHVHADGSRVCIVVSWPPDETDSVVVVTCWRK